MKAQRVLILESNELFANELRDCVLAREGYEVCGMTGSGEEGIALIKSEDPDLVILSLFLKGFDGFTVMEEAKRSEKKGAFIVMGNFSDDKIINRAISLGARYYLMKPVEASVVVDRAAEVAGEGVPARRESLERRRANSLDERISNIFISIGIPPPSSARNSRRRRARWSAPSVMPSRSRGTAGASTPSTPSSARASISAPKSRPTANSSPSSPISSSWRTWAERDRARAVLRGGFFFSDV